MYSYLHEDPTNKKKAFYKCSCGTIKSVSKANVNREAVTSCGCLTPKRVYKELEKGTRFGRLVVDSKGPTRYTSSGKASGTWLCICDCGNSVYIVTDRLTTGNSKSCGCGKVRKGKDHHNYTHGLSGEENPIYQKWTHIRQRCFDTSEDSTYKDVFLDEPWLSDYMSFHNWFIEQLDGREYTSLLEVDRYPNRQGNYGPSNCRLVTHTENQRNRNDNLNLAAFDSVDLPLSELVEKYSETGYSTVQLRLQHGWNIERALMSPPTPQVRGERRGASRRPENFSMKPTEQEKAIWLQYLNRPDKQPYILEEEIKANLKVHLESLGKDQDIHFELFTGHAIADVAAISNDKYIGYEIKSDGDDLNRFINSQRLHYPYFFDECWLVVTEKHVEKATNLLRRTGNKGIPECWGLMDNNFNIIQPAETNDWLSEIDRLRWVIGRIWKQELIQELKANKVKGYSKLASFELGQLLIKTIGIEAVRSLARRYIKLHRDSLDT